MEFLEGYPWPGNVRELENTVERTVVLAGSEALTAKDIPILNSMVETPEPVPAPVPATNGVVTFSPLSRRSKERQLYERVPLREKDIREAMHNAGGIQTHAARMLGVSLRQLRYALSRFGIKAAEFKY
jgi:Nif-specific regulatory protein